MAVKKPTIEVAFEILSSKKRPVPFQKLFEEVATVAEIPDALKSKKKAQLYSALSMDSRFVSLSENTWDLKSRRSYDEAHVEVESLDDDEEVEIEDVGDDLSKAEEEYN